MNLADPSMELLAASGGDTVKIFDIKLEPNDPCVLSYSPSPSCLVNSVKWNHTSKLFFSFTFRAFFSFLSLRSAWLNVWWLRSIL